MRGRETIALGAAVAALLGAPAAAQAAVTVGSTLAPFPNSSRSTADPVPGTFVTSSLTPAAAVAAGPTSPVNGTIVRWRIRAGANVSPTTLRVIRRSGGLYTATGTSASVTPAPNTVSEYAAALPIEIGQLLGITCCPGDDGGQYFRIAGGTLELFFTPFPDGGPLASPGSSSPEHLLVNADIEPTSSFTVLKRKAKKRGKVALRLLLPNPGTVTVSKVSKKAKAGALRTRSALVPSAGEVVLVLKPTKSASARLREVNKMKTKIKIAYTPTGGAATVARLKVKLRR